MHKHTYTEDISIHIYQILKGMYSMAVTFLSLSVIGSLNHCLNTAKYLKTLILLIALKSILYMPGLKTKTANSQI